ncbi:unnamed protein product [Effrenium voratum]|uniref:EF-hand domain-containing protein n=1 Tax=Effrenium voratum TaxID=2562239 RepID=A0AA36IRQ6_9DINO|nr:unnamed protein product [Effrenium voratum]CAJ1431229.1 unnamed protein product [Effrenium voratum]
MTKVQGLNRLRWKYARQTFLPWKLALCKLLVGVRPMAVAYVLVMLGQLVLCALEKDQELLWRQGRAELQNRLRQELTPETYRALVDSGFREVHPNDALHWEFTGPSHSWSLMYSFTLVASIGYGDMSPTSDRSRLFCIAFTAVATPTLVVMYLGMAKNVMQIWHFFAMMMTKENILTFHKYDYDGSGQLDRAEFAIALHDLGYPVSEEDVDILMEEVNICDSSQVTIQEFSQALLLLEFPNARRQKVRLSVFLSAICTFVWLMIGTLVFTQLEAWGFVESLWFCWETLMTIGLGDYVPQTNAGRWFNLTYGFIGLGQLSLLLQAIVDLLTKHTSMLGRLEKRLMEGAQGAALQDVRKHHRNVKTRSSAEARIRDSKASLGSPCSPELKVAVSPSSRPSEPCSSEGWDPEGYLDDEEDEDLVCL